MMGVNAGFTARKMKFSTKEKSKNKYYDSALFSSFSYGIWISVQHEQKL